MKKTILGVAGFYLVAGVFMLLALLTFVAMRPTGWSEHRASIIVFGIVSVLWITASLLLFSQFSRLALLLFSCSLAITAFLIIGTCIGVVLLPVHVMLCRILDVVLFFLLALLVPVCARYFHSHTIGVPSRT